MKIEIRPYKPPMDYDKLLSVIKSEGEEWEEYLDPRYQAVLEKSITYVALVNDEVCGFSRSIDDFGVNILLIDLLVQKAYRGHAIGKKLMERLSTDFPGQPVFVLSDVDEYYKKLGYEREGSVFRVG